MKRLWIVAALLLAAGTAGAAHVETALAEDNLLWSVDGAAASKSLVLTLRIGPNQQSVVVPTTEDEEIDGAARLAWDPMSRMLFVLYRRQGAEGDEIRLARRYASGRWAPPAILASGVGAGRSGLQLLVSHVKEESTTLVHAAWWTLSPNVTAEYAMAAFHGAELLSTSLDRLDDLAAVLTVASQDEDTGSSVHPPMAMVRSGETVDVAWGAPRTTALTVVTIQPRKIDANARIWRPSGRTGRRTPSAQLTSSSSLPVESFIVSGNIVLYTPDARFRYVVFEEGKWTPVRTFATDEKLTSEDLIRELRRSVGQQGAAGVPDSR